MLEIVTPLFLRELRTLRREVEAYADEGQLWASAAGIANSGGQLAHHLTGNLRHYIGAVLGGTGYERHRDDEFARSDLSRDELLARIEATIEEVERTLGTLGPEQLQGEYPQVVGGHQLPTAAFLVHLLAHLAYHLGQVDYHRRITTGSGTTANAVSTAEIPGARPAS